MMGVWNSCGKASSLSPWSLRASLSGLSTWVTLVAWTWQDFLTWWLRAKGQMVWEQSRSCVASQDPASEVTKCYFSFLCVTRSKRGDRDPPPINGGRSENLQSHFELLHSFENYYLYFLISFQKEEIRNSCHSDDDDKLPAFETAGKVKL